MCTCITNYFQILVRHKRSSNEVMFKRYLLLLSSKNSSSMPLFSFAEQWKCCAPTDVA